MVRQKGARGITLVASGSMGLSNQKVRIYFVFFLDCVASTEAQKVLGAAINTAESVLIGQDFKVTATVTNKSSSERCVHVFVCVCH